MELDGLTLLHLSKPGACPQDVAILNDQLVHSFYLETCQRHIWILDAAHNLSLPACAERHSGAQAYSKLLEITTGLASLIPGEADVFGQFRRAWDTYRLKDKASTELTPWIQRLYADTKAIRHAHLQGIGGASYGTRVRRLLKKMDPEAQHPVIVYGAGALSKAVLPYLADFKVGLTNRSFERLEDLLSQVQKLPPRLSFEIEPLQNGFHHAIFAVPAEAELTDVTQNTLSVLHLGITHDGWANLKIHPSFAGKLASLTELFEVEREQDALRIQQLSAARAACHSSATKRVSEDRGRQRYTATLAQAY